MIYACHLFVLSLFAMRVMAMCVNCTWFTKLYFKLFKANLLKKFWWKNDCNGNVVFLSSYLAPCFLKGTRGGPAWCFDTFAIFFDYKRIYRYYNAKTIHFLEPYFDRQTLPLQFRHSDSLQWNASFFKWTAPNATSGHGVRDPDHTTGPVVTPLTRNP